MWQLKLQRCASEFWLSHECLVNEEMMMTCHAKVNLQGGAEEDDKKTMTKQYGDVLFERYMRFLCKVRCVALQSIACVLECSAAS